jgi:thiol-disulfide isomerase/thioredoxin
MNIKHILWVVTLLGSVTTSFAQNGAKINANGSTLSVSQTALLYGQREPVVRSLQQNTFVLKGKIKGQETGMLKLSYPSADGKNVQDSTAIQNGTFEFKGQVSEPVMAYFTGAIKSRGLDDPNTGYFFIEPRQLSMEVTAGDFKNLKLKGSKTQDEITALEMVKAPITKEFKPISEAYQKANEVYIQARKDKKPEAELDALKEKAAAIRDQFEPFNDRKNKIDTEFIKTHPNSYYAAYLLRWKVSSMSLANSTQYYEALSPAIKQSSYGKEIMKEIKSLQGGSPGSMASVFSTPDINGQPLSLADFKGKKYVLLDFWASWCVPCRKGNPHLLGLYSKYKDKGLEIIGVSDDDSNHEAWKKAVEQDNIGVWKHVLRGLKRTATGYDKSADISAPYGIHTLPTKILIDKNGMIVGRYGGGGENDEAMDKKLAEIFN